MATVKIVDLSTLKSNIALWLNRTDLTDQIGVFVQMAEVKLTRDRRARHLTSEAYSITSDALALPTGCLAIESLYHDGPTYYGEIGIVGSAGELAERKQRVGLTGVPRYAANVAGSLRFAPAPDATYATKITFWQTLTQLSADADTNWLILAHPDIYLYAALLESAPYLVDDDRIAVWQNQLEQKLEELNIFTETAQFSGKLSRSIAAIG